MSGALIELDGISLSFEGITALVNVRFQISRSGVTGIIGPNGAGKTSLFNCISGLYRPNAGTVRFDGTDITRLSQPQIARLGVSRTFQHLSLFESMTVHNNVRVGAQISVGDGFWGALFRSPVTRRAEAAIDDIAAEAMEILDLGNLADEPVATLNFATRKRVELARALAARPKVILLDEPAGGLNFAEVQRLGQLIRRVADVHGICVVLIEHHMNLVMDTSDKIVVLNFGSVIAEGDAPTVRQHPDVIRAYLGDV